MPTVTVDGVTMSYLDVGSGGPPVVLLHAFPFHSGMWQPQVDDLSDRFRLVTPDLKGFGGSDAPDDLAAYSIDGYADEVVGLLRTLELERVVVVGLSMGGYVAFSVLRRHRPMVSGLVLADTRADPDSPQVLERRNNHQRQVREEGTGPVIDAHLGTLLSDHTHQHRPDVVERARALMDNPPAGFLGALEAMKSRPDASADLDRIDVPTLVLVGNQDQPSPPEVARGMHERIRDSRLVVLPDAGHLSNLEAPEPFNQALRGFLEEL